MAIDTKQHTGIIGHLVTCKHIGGCRTTCQDIALRFFLQPRINLQKGHNRTKSSLLLKSAVAGIDIHRLEHIHHLPLAPNQFLITFCGNRDKHRQIKQVLVVVCDTVFDIITSRNRIGQFLIIGAGILQALELSAVQSNSLCNLINCSAAIFSM